MARRGKSSTPLPTEFILNVHQGHGGKDDGAYLTLLIYSDSDLFQFDNQQKVAHAKGPMNDTNEPSSNWASRLRTSSRKQK
jgi:hypothetical protein